MKNATSIWNNLHVKGVEVILILPSCCQGVKKKKKNTHNSEEYPSPHPKAQWQVGLIIQMTIFIDN